MAKESLDRLADDTVSSWKGFFTQRINNGEDPTICMQMFLSFLESNKEENPQLFKKIASKIDPSLFAPPKKLNQIASLDDFITTYHKLVNKLIELNPKTPYKADYERQKILIATAKNPIKERLHKEKEEKKRILDDEYRRILSAREKEYKSITNNSLRRGIALCFILFVVLLLVDILLPAPSSEYQIFGCITIFGVIGAGIVNWDMTLRITEKKRGCWVLLVLFGVGGAAGAGVGAIFVYATPYSIFPWLILGIILAVIYKFKVAAIQLNPDERSAYNTSLGSIEKHISHEGEYDIAQSTVRILATYDATLDLAIEGKTLRGHKESVLSISFSPDGEKLASGSADNTIIIWHLATGKAEATLGGHTQAVSSVCCSPDGEKLASGSEDNIIIIWDLATGKVEATLREHTQAVSSVCFSPDGEKLASGSDDNTIIIWDLATGKAKGTLREHTQAVSSVCFSPDGEKLASGSDDNTIIIWDLTTSKAEGTLRKHTQAVSSVCFSPDGEKLASVSDDNTIIIWDLATGKAEKTLWGHTESVCSVCFSPDGEKLVSGSEDCTIIIWDLAISKAEKTLWGHEDTVPSVSFSPDGKRLASGSEDKTIKLFEVVR
jgi:WD40 repeat protein